MNDNLKEQLESEEGKKKAETLFSKKFMEYLSNKKSSANTTNERNTWAIETNTVPQFKEAFSRNTSSDETTASDLSVKYLKKTKKKGKHKQETPLYRILDFNYAVRNKVIQCSLIKDAEEIALPEELKPLLVNMTILLQELKQNPGSNEHEDLHNLISKITILITEFSRRQVKKIENENKGEHAKSLDKAVEGIVNLLNDYKNGPSIDYEDAMREYKRMEKDVNAKDHQIAEAQKKITKEFMKYDLKVSDVNQRVRNSILNNERLKAEIKFNQGHIKKYKKILLEKEWTKHKLDNDLIHLKKKLSKGDFSDDGFDKQSSQLEPFPGSENSLKSNLNKIKPIKVKKDKKLKVAFKGKV